MFSFFKELLAKRSIQSPVGQPARPARLCQVIRFGPKEGVAIIDVAGERMVVGISTYGISLLKSFDARSMANPPTLDSPISRPVAQGEVAVQPAPPAQRVQAPMPARQQQPAQRAAAPANPHASLARPATEPSTREDDFGDIFRDVEAAIQAASDRA